MNLELRATPREKLALRVLLADGSTAVTRDISASGIYLVMPRGSVVEDWVSFEFDMPEAGLKFTATGEVVRTEAGADGVGVALKLHHPRLVPL